MLKYFSKFWSGKSKDSRVIALDGDGVLIDYHEGYAMAWERAFGERPQVRDPQGYHPMDYWNVPRLGYSERLHLKEKGFTRDVWASMPAIAGAREACERLNAAGFSLVCVTAMSARYHKEREHNLHSLGFNVTRVYTAPHAGLGNPKARIISKLSPVAFVDDYLPYLQGIPQSTWSALIEGRKNNSPNRLQGFKEPNSRHDSLIDFVQFWLGRKSELN